MKKLAQVLLIVLLFVVLPVLSAYIPTQTSAQAAGFTVDHTSVELYDQIPAEYLQAAEQIKITFMDRSVGSNINEGITCLSYPTWASSPSHCRRYYIDSTLTAWKTFSSRDAVIPEVIKFPGGNDRSNVTFLFNSSSWEADVQTFINLYPTYLSQDIFTFQHNYLHVDAGSTIDNFYFDPNYSGYNIYDLVELENQYPERDFIYWTTSLARGIGTADSTSFNKQMRVWATSNDKVLFDVADIESYSPDGNACVNASGYPIICKEYTTEVNGGHLGSVSAGKIRIAKAFWVLLARLAGWQPFVIPTDTSTPTDTLTPTPTDTPTLTPTDVPTATPTLPGPYIGAPACSAHDPVVWHGVWNYDLGCHYDHHHGNDPRTLDSLFGRSFIDNTGGDVQISWQPGPTSDLDFRRKHYGLFWMVRDHRFDDRGCASRETDACLLAFRAEIHALSDVYDIVRRAPDGTLTGSFHVFRLEALLCLEADPTNCGIVRAGGRQYLGDANYATSTPDFPLLISTLFDVAEPRDLWGTNTARPQSLHSTLNPKFQTWYPVQERGLFRIATLFEDSWSFVDPNDPWRLNFSPSRDQSSIKPEIIGVGFPFWLLNIVQPVNNIVNWSGFVDATGYPITSCSGSYCPPLIYENVPVGNYQYNGAPEEYDFLIGDKVHKDPSGWLKHPGIP